MTSLFQFQHQFDREMSSKHNARTKRVKEYCAKHGKDSLAKDLDLSDFVVLEKYQSVYCPVPKVASTVWKRILARAMGLNITTYVHQTTQRKMKHLGQYPLEERKNILKTYTKFMFVREPFERLLSAYRNCFLGTKFKRNHYWWRNLRYRIREVLVENGGLRINLNADNTTFEEFLTYLVLKWTRNSSSEFNAHWRPQSNLCHPCHIQYDFIGHYETLQDDATFILKQANLQDKVLFPQWQPTNTSLFMHEYYSGVSPLRLSQLKSIYKEDIGVFGYTIPEF